MPLADDGTGFTLSFLYYEPGGTIPPVGPNPDQEIGGELTDFSDWADNLSDNPRVSAPAQSGLLGLTSGFLLGINDWFMDQWWITPNPVDFGSVSSPKVIDVDVLNTHRTGDFSLTALGTLPSGVTSPATFPQDINFFEVITLQFTAAPQGDPTFSQFVDFVFTNETPTVQFLGTRVVIFPFPPELPVTEQLSWLTNIMEHRDQTEQRHSLRTRSRKRIAFTFMPKDDQEAALIKNAVLTKQPFLFGIPEWWDLRRTTNTTTLAVGTTVISCNPDNADFTAGEPVLIRRPDATFEDGTIDSIIAGTSITLEQGTSGTIPPGSFIIPILTGYVVQSPVYADELNAQQRIRIEFDAVEAPERAFSDAEFTSSSFTKHNGLLVFDDPNMVSSGKPQTRQLVFPRGRMDSGVGIIQQFPHGTVARASGRKEALANTSASLWNYRRLLEYLRGSWKDFYLPTFQNELPLEGASFDLNLQTIVIKNVGINEITIDDPHKTAFFRVISDGRIFLADVTGSVDNGDGTESLTLATPPKGTSEVITTDDLQIGWAELCRIEGDVATILHEQIGQARIRINVRGVKT